MGATYVMHRSALAWALGALLLPACARNPVSGRPEFVVVSKATEAKLGEEAAAEVKREMGLVDDPALIAYVRTVGARLAAQSPRQDVTYTFEIVDQPEPNAFALPAGHVYVTRGMLILLDAEDELAGVLAHEIAHVAARHAVQRVSRAAPLGILTGVVATATGVVSPLLGGVVGGVGGTVNEAMLAPYSRDQEREADRVGQEIVARAGFDPAGLGQALAALQRMEQATEKGPRRASFFDSHPGLSERVERVTAHAAELPRSTAQPVAANSNDFVRHLDGLVVGDDAAQGVFEGPVFLHPVIGFSVRFPDGWKTQNTPAQVAAAAPDGNTGLIVTLAADGDDPAAGVRAFEQEAKRQIGVPLRRSTVNGHPVVQASVAADSGGRPVALELAWIALGGHVYRLAGITPASGVAALRPRIDAVLASFHTLTPAECANVPQRRLRLEAARAGDTPATIARRSQTPWSPEMVAIVNGVEVDTPFTVGRLVKVARTERYGVRQS